MKVAIVGAGFSPAEADELRRAMATFKSRGGVDRFRDKMVGGMLANGYTRDFAERTFKQIEGFGSYGFPESHAASFAKIAYASSWMKCHHPDIFCAALLNAQPMGFYAPAQIVRDAREHGVDVLPPCVNASRWDCTLEGNADQKPVRLGLRLVKGLSNKDGALIVAAAMDRPFASIDDAWQRSGVPTAALERLAEADAFACLGIDRRQALWQVRGLGYTELPLFKSVENREPAVVLRSMAEGRQVVEDYGTFQLSLRHHPLRFLRPELDRQRIVPAGRLSTLKDGASVTVAGIILVRQRPGKGNVCFITLEDETGIANVIVWQRDFERQRRAIMGSAMITVRGKLQIEGKVIHIVSDRIEDSTPLLRQVGQMDFPHHTGRGDGATHGCSPDRGDLIRVQTRDFH